MSRLITQLAEDEPKVVVIGSVSPLQQEVVAYCRRQQMAVESCSFHQAASEIAKNNWYKVVLIVEITPTFDQMGFDQVWQAFLSLPSSQRISICTFPTPIDTRMPEYDTWSQVSQLALTLLTRYRQLAGQATLFFGQDVYTGDHWWPFASKSVVYDPHLPLYVQSVTGFWQACKPYFFSPQAQSLLVQGKKHESTALLKEVKRQQETLHSQPVEILDLPATTLELPIEVDQKLSHDTDSVPDLVAPLLAASVPAMSTSKTTRNTLPLPQRHSTPGTKKKAASKASSTPPSKVSLPPKPIITPNQEIVEKVQAVFSEKRTTEKKEVVAELAKADLKARGRKQHRRWLFYTAVGFISLGSGLVLVSLGYLLSIFLMKQALWGTLADLKQSSTQELVISPALEQRVSMTVAQTNWYSHILPLALFGEATSWVELGKNLVAAQKDVQQVEGLISQAVASVFNPAVTLSPTPLALEEKYQHISLLVSVVSQFEDEVIDPEKQQLLKSAKNWLQQRSNELTAYQRLQPILGPLLGAEGKRKYAIVFQNNQELRPTGGFIQSVGILTFANNQLIDTQVYNVYELDERLQASVTPPTEVTQLLGEHQWYLRDSNWNPDFTQSGESIRWFIEHETNQQLDGVLAFTVPALEALLKVVGPLDIPEYNEVITDRNLAERLEFHSEVQLTGQNDTQEYAELLLQRLLQKLQTTTPDNGHKIAQVLHDQLQRKQMFLNVSDAGEQATIQALGWSGGLLVPQCPTQLSTATECVVDTLAVVDANIGVNKANYHLQRSESHHITLSETNATHTHTVLLENTSQTNAWPQGPYSSYLRFYLPEGAQLTQVKVNNQAMAAKDIVQTEYQAFTVVGVVTQTPIQQQTTVDITYSTPLAQTPNSAYAFFYQKQAGLEIPLTTVSLTHSPTLTPRIIAPQANVQLGTITFNEFEDDHVFVGVSF
ncbi:MAG TPA: DUF4012 domain-containing protein [Patescibacteria group bacterium]